MKVSNQNLNPGLKGLENTKNDVKVGSGKEKSDSAKASAASSSEILASAEVQLSPRAQSMAKAKEIASAETVDSEKVARLQKLIDAGEYKVDASAIADRMVDEHLLMPS